MQSLKRVQSALRAATETFAFELASPSSTAPDWDGFQWTMAKAAAVLHGVTPLMASTLRWRGPSDFQQFVSEQYQQTVARQRRILLLLERIDELARARWVPFIALKGCALHALGLYRCGERPMADIDLLVSPDQTAAMTTLLCSIGYERSSTVWKHYAFEPVKSSEIAAHADCTSFGEHADAPIKIDLHTHLTERLGGSLVAISEQVFSRQLEPGLNPYPSRTALMAHLLLHAAGTIVTRSLRMIQLHDIALLSRRFCPQDWEQLQRLPVSGQPLWWALPVLQLADRYYRGCVPPQVLAQLYRAGPRALRRLARHKRLCDVSYATLARQAFPGLAFSPSLADKLRCLRSRVAPGREQREVANAMRREPWVTATGWSQLPYARRVAQHLLMRPPRPQPMYIVRAAIAAAPDSLNF